MNLKIGQIYKDPNNSSHRWKIIKIDGNIMYYAPTAFPDHEFSSTIRDWEMRIEQDKVALITEREKMEIFFFGKLLGK